MLVPSTVVRSCGGDLPEPKKLRRFIILAIPVLSPIEAASSRHFSAPANSAASSPDRQFETCSVFLQQLDRTYLGRGIMKTTFAPPTKANIFSMFFRRF
jgi:hypothetical protein